MVERIESYTTLSGDKVLKVILKPTKEFPNGYFYTDDNEITRKLITDYNWHLIKHISTYYVTTHTNSFSSGNRNAVFFHQLYAFHILGYNPACIDHLDGVGFNNTDSNLNVVTTKQNRRNSLVKGYTYTQGHFYVSYKLNSKSITRGSYKTEPEVLLATYNTRREVFKDYDYNFYLDRRTDLDILDAELTGRITRELAIYYHIKRYVEQNPWYLYRYDLFNYCRQNNITVSPFKLDNQGFMINSATCQKLCPY